MGASKGTARLTPALLFKGVGVLMSALVLANLLGLINLDLWTFGSNGSTAPSG